MILSNFAEVAPTAHAASSDCVPSDYNATVRPDEGVTTVEMAIYLIDVLDIKGANQSATVDFIFTEEWTDARLAWGNSDDDRLDHCVVSVDQIWAPGVRLLNRRQLTSEEPERVTIDRGGRVSYWQRTYGDISMPFDLINFPIDEQVLRFRYVSVGYGPDEVRLVVDRNNFGWSKNFSITEWSIGSPVSRSGQYHLPLRDRYLSELTFEFGAERHFGHYVMNYIFPLALIVMMSWAVFWIDPSQLGIQTGLAASMMVTLVVFLYRLGLGLPKVAYITRMDIFIGVSIALVFLAFVEAIATGMLFKGGKEKLALKIDRSARIGFPALFAALLVLFFLA